MIYLGIALVVLLLVAPIVALLPSARQREQMALRRQAMAAGLRTELTTIDDPDPDQDRYVSVTGKRLEPKLKCIAYRLSRPRPPAWRDLPAVEWSLIRVKDGGWRWQDAPSEALSRTLAEAIPGVAREMPADAVRIDESHYVISVYWLEQGGSEGLDAIVTGLKTLAGTPPHVPPPPEDSMDPS